ncbi:MAG: arginine deiminase family protein [Myxococcota bacterium]
MRTINRRQLLRGIAATSVLAPTLARGQRRPFLTSDVGRLRTVLVHTISPNEQPVGQWDPGTLPYAETDIDAASQQQQALARLLRGSGAEVIEVADALASAIDATRGSGVFEAWVRAAFPRLASEPAKVTVDALLGRDRSQHYRLGPDGNYRRRLTDSTSTMWTRDSAFMTPQGLVICNAATERRGRENMLMRFLYRHSPMLRSYPVVFDAVEEGMIIEGGDAHVVNETTLFLGTGNRTDPRIAPVLAKRLNMDVLAVQTVEREFMRRSYVRQNDPAGELRLFTLHLDTCFTHVGPRHALMLPYLFEKDYATDGPLARFIRGARAETQMSAEDAEASLKILKGLGTLKFYARRTGKMTDLGATKLADYLKAKGYRFTWTGGVRPKSDDDAFQHFMAVTYPEQRRQASNIVQATPNRVIAYAGNPATKAALEADGIAVDTFGARDLWPWHGGPHCLTQPLRRG